MSFRSSLSKARGLGSAHNGLSHWWAQRITAIALIPLSIYFLLSVVSLISAGASYEASILWIKSPLNALAVILLTVTACYHAYLGVKVVIEDYIHHEGFKHFSIIGKMLGFILIAAICVFAVFSLYFKG